VPRHRALRIAATVAGPLLAACAPAMQQSSGGSIEARFWRLNEIRGQAVLPVEEGRELHITFDTEQHRVSGSAGCNRFSGPYTRAADRLTIGPLISTKMACADDRLNRQETDYMAALQATDRYMVSGDTLTLASGNERVARFIGGIR
jgi:heat shock protein HslJ